LSIQAISWVLEESEAEGLDRLVMIVLANYANEDWLAWPSQRTIQREARIAKNTVRAAVGRLVESGELEIVERGDHRRSTRYRLTRTPARKGGSDLTHPTGLGGSEVGQPWVNQSDPEVGQRWVNQSDPEPRTNNREPARAPARAPAREATELVDRRALAAMARVTRSSIQSTGGVA